MLCYSYEQLMNEQSRKVRTITYLFTIDLILILISDFAFFMMPKIVQAYSAIGLSGQEAQTADEYLCAYRDITYDVFDLLKPETDPSKIVNIFPEPVHRDDQEFYNYSGYYHRNSTIGSWAWNHALSLHRQGKIYGADTSYQCTFFAQMWFYDMFGFNSSNGASGNGSDFASTVYNSAYFTDENGVTQRAFEYGDKPHTKGIVSIYSNTYGGHVLCVDDVDYINGTITISEGNVGGNGEVRIRETMSLSRFYALNPGRKVYVNPTYEFLLHLSGE